MTDGCDYAWPNNPRWAGPGSCDFTKARHMCNIREAHREHICMFCAALDPQETP